MSLPATSIAGSLAYESIRMDLPHDKPYFYLKLLNIRSHEKTKKLRSGGAERSRVLVFGYLVADLV